MGQFKTVYIIVVCLLTFDHLHFFNWTETLFMFSFHQHAIENIKKEIATVCQKISRMLNIQNIAKKICKNCPLASVLTGRQGNFPRWEL